MITINLPVFYLVGVEVIRPVHYSGNCILNNPFCQGMQCLSRTIVLKIQMNKSFIKTKAALKKKHFDQHDILRLYTLDKTVRFRRFLGNYRV